MAVVNVTRKWSGKSLEKSDDGRTLVEFYTVLLDAIETNENVITNAPGVPPMNSPYMFDLFMRLARKRGTPIGPLLWEVECVYMAVGSGEQGEDPVDMTPRISWRGATSIVAIDNDADGKPITNTAGENLDPPASAEIGDPVLVIQRNSLSVNPAALRLYHHAVNSDFFIAEPGQAKLIRWDADEVKQGDLIYYSHVIEIQFREGLPLQLDGTGGPSKAWYERRVNEGYRELVWVEDFATLVPFEIEDANGNKITRPMLLGKPTTPHGEVLRLPEGAAPVFLEIKRFREIPFGPMNFL